MSVESFKRELWESAIIEQFKETSVADLVTKKPSSVEGSKAIFNTASLTNGLQKYTGKISWEEINTTSIELIFDQQYYYAFARKDIDKVQLAGDVMLPICRQQAEAVKATIDSAIFAEAVTGAKSGNVIGSKTTKKDITTCDEAYDYIVDLGTKLDENNVPNVGRYIIAPPAFVNLLAKDKRIIDNAPILANGVVVGMEVNGMQIIKTTNCPANTVIAMSNIAVGYGKQFEECEALRLQEDFQDAVRGLVVYGVKTLQPEGVPVLNYN